MAKRTLPLPYPRLELRWRKPTAKEKADSDLGATWCCDYMLVLHKRHNGDARCNGPRGAYAARDVEFLLNTTARGGGPEEPLNPDGTVDTPFRDGCHIQWDSRVLRIPAYAVYGKKFTKVEIRR